MVPVLSFQNFFLLNKYIKGWIYSERSSGFVRSSSFLISYCSLSYVSITYTLLVLSIISWWIILHILGHLGNYIMPLSQFTSELYFTNQLHSKNISMLFKSVTIDLFFVSIDLDLEWCKSCDFSVLGAIYVEYFE